MPRCLIVFGGWQGHEPAQTSARIEALLEPAGFAVELSQDLSVYSSADLQSYDLIVPNWTNGSISPEAAGRLQAAVSSGVGLGGFHGGMGDAFRENVGFQFLVGGQFVGHPGGIREYRVEIARPEDPIVEGIADFDYRSEQYFMHVDPTIEVIATTRFDATIYPWLDGVRTPVCWKKQFGEGRVFYTSLGHVASEFDVEPMRVMLMRGLYWASRK
jgi:type 1 glutamine amidotransferase